MPDGERQLLLVEDDPTHALLMRERLLACADSVEHAATRGEAVRALEHAFDLVVLDIGLPDGSGLDIQRWLGERREAVPIVFVTADDRAEQAVEAVRAGAADYVVKRPSYLEQLVRAVEGALPHEDGERAAPPARPAACSDAILGRTPGMLEVRRRIEDYAPLDAPVLICGETGTGKELVARAFHRSSPRARLPFVAVNCAAISPALFESELFGSVRGAYTGASRDRHGLVTAAGEGTLFLDEVGELPLDGQAKLLRLLEDGSYRPVGSPRERRSRVRVLAATNRDLRAPVEDGHFRADLYYRLHVLAIPIPPLRQRRADIPLLVEHYLAQFAGESEPRAMAPEALAQLVAWRWPGNVRELKHAVERTLLHRGKGPILHFDLGVEAPQEPRGAGRGRIAADLLTGCLHRHAGHLGPAADELGVSIRTIQRRMKDLALELDDFRVNRS